MTEQEAAVTARLAELGIPFTRKAHPPVATVDAAVEHWADIDATHCKNLFLRNQKGNRHYLVVLEISKRADLKEIVKLVGDDRLRYSAGGKASPVTYGAGWGRRRRRRRATTGR